MANHNSTEPAPPEENSWTQMEELIDLDVTEARNRLDQFNQAKSKILKSLQDLEQKIQTELKTIEELQKLRKNGATPTQDISTPKPTEEETWTVVSNKKRKRTTEEQEKNAKAKMTKSSRPPPITVDGLDPKHVVNLLKGTFNDETSNVTSGVNVIHSNKTRITVKSIEHYKELYSTLMKKNIGFFAHPIHGTLNKRATLRGLPNGYNEEEVKGMLPTNVILVKQFTDRTGKLIPVYGITFPPQTTKEEINALKILDCYRVNWNHSKPKKQGTDSPTKIKQCHNCQGFNHMARFCHKITKCKKCSLNHNTNECTSETPKCTNCNGPHRADHQECPAWKKISEAVSRREERLYKKKQTISNTTARPAPIPTVNPWLARGTRLVKTPPRQATNNLTQDNKKSQLQTVIEKLLEIING